MKKVRANFNMTFNNDNHFQKDKEYSYRQDSSTKKFFVTTEDGTEQEFFLSEFNTLFTALE